MFKVKNEKELIKSLKKDIDDSGRKKIYFLAGHFPLLYFKEEKLAVEAIDCWGIFSIFTLEIACEVAQYAKEIGKEVRFVFFVDDHAYEDMSGLGSRERSARRNRLYSLRSGQKAQLPEIYRNILLKNGFSENDVLRHDHGKEGRSDCLYFSEKILRLSERKIDNLCAKEYIEFIEDQKYFDKNLTHIISFIPNRCRGHICEVALHQIEGFSSSHIAMETMTREMDRSKVFSEGFGVMLASCRE